MIYLQTIPHTVTPRIHIESWLRSKFGCPAILPTGSSVRLKQAVTSAMFHKIATVVIATVRLFEATP